MSNPWPPPPTSSHDPELVSAITDELRNKLTLEVDQFLLGTIQISLTRSYQSVQVAFNESSMIIKMTRLPDGSTIDQETHSICDPDFDPIKSASRYVDRALKLEVSYEKRKNESKLLLESLL